jgi:preprotein translocase subunit SecE
VNDYKAIIIWGAAILAVFGFLWWKGHLRRLSAYVLETREELRKCTWPSLAELKGSTVVVVVSTLLLGVFTVGVDFIVAYLVKALTQIKL